MTPREQEFHNAMVDIYRRARTECRYNAIRFLQMLTDYGGLGTAKRLLASDEVQYGFTELWEHGRLDLTVEAHVLQPEFRDLFTDVELQRAKSRLTAHGYDTDVAD